MMDIYPAMDLLGGAIVRLREGRFGEKTVYGNDFTGTAKSFADAGSEWIHVIDLEGAKTGTPCHLHIIEKLRSEGLKVQYGGGLRTEENIASALDAGAERVYAGSLPAKSPENLEELFHRFGDRLIPAIDIRSGKTAVSGWQKDGSLSPEMLLEKCKRAGFRLFLVTAVNRDGTASGPDRKMYRELRGIFPEVSLIAAGGISSLDDIRCLKADGLEGAVLGKSLYEGTIDLKEAIREASSC